MNVSPARAALAAPAPTDPDRALRAVCDEMEAAFFRQLFQVMRQSTGTEDEVTGSSSGEEMLTAFLDDKLALEAAEDLTGGIGEALYRQLAQRMAMKETTGE